MRHAVFVGSLLCLFLVDVQLAFSRDVQLRSRPEDVSNATSSKTPIATSPQATQKLSTEERVNRLERILDSQGLVNMLVRLENLQNELQILRGELELHTHELTEIKRRQRDLYLDIDRRLLQMERKGNPQSPSAGAKITPPAVTPSPQPAAPVQKPAATSNTTPTTTAATSTPQPTATDFASEQKAYQHAFDLLRELQYEQAINAFRGFLKQYPQGRYAHIAQYWSGEANYAQRQFKKAISDYQLLIDNYPSSPKLAEAALKIGYSYYELKNYPQAEKTLQQLIANFPGTTEAGQAQNLIKRIRLNR